MSASKFFDYGTEGPESVDVPRFLGQATTQDWAIVGAHCERRRFHDGEAIVRIRDVDRSLLIILEGSVDTVVERRGRTHWRSSAPAGTVVGELGFLDGQPRSANVVASSDGELLRMSMTSFDALAASNPRLGRMILFDLGCVLAFRLRRLTDVLTQGR